MTETTTLPTPPTPVPPRRFGGPAREAWSFLELFALAGIAITQPLFDALRIRAADAVVPLDPSRSEILLLAAAVLLLVPVTLWAIEVVVGLVVPRARTPFHLGLLGLLVAVITYEVLGNRWDLSVGALVALGAIVGIVAFRVLRRFEAAHLFLRFLALAPLVFTVVFLTGRDIAPLAFGGDRAPNADVQVGNPKRVVEIVADELALASLMDGTGHIDRGLFPNIAALADDSHWFRNTTSVAPYTQAAVPALASGDYPEHPDALPTAANFPNTLFSLLGNTYSIHASEDSTEVLCGRSACGDAKPNTSNQLVKNARDLWWEFASPGTQSGPKCLCDATTLQDGMPKARRFLAGITKSDGPRLDYLHVLLPHAPWHLHPNGQSYDDTFNVPPGLSLDTLKWTSAKAAVAQRQRHLLQLQALDAYVGRVTDRLKALGEYDDSVIVLTADHGVSFADQQGYRLPSEVNYQDIMWVPLVVKLPGNAGGGTIDDRPARTIDVMPTIADALDAKIPWKIDGRSLLGAPTNDVDRRFLEWPSGFAFLAPKDAHFEQYDTTVGFARVLATPAVNPTLPTESRIYGYGAASPYGSVVGRAAADLAGTSEPPHKVLITNATDYLAVNTEAPFAPWTAIKGGLDGKEQVPIAVSVNGVIAGIARTTPNILGTPAFTVILDPKYFANGNNYVQVYVIRGTPEAPRLVLATRV